MSSPASIEDLDESVQQGNISEIGVESEQVGSQIGAPLTRVPSENDYCPICREPFDIPATAAPCGHKFDLLCIYTWASQARDSALAFCPICRGLIVAIKHHWNSSYSGTGELNPDLQPVYIPLWRNFDEAILPRMTGRQIHAARERQRLRGLPRKTRSCTMLPQPQNFWVKHGKYFGNMIEFYDLLIVQEGLVTTSKLKNWVLVDFKHRDTFLVPPEYRTGKTPNKCLPSNCALTEHCPRSRGCRTRRRSPRTDEENGSKIHPFRHNRNGQHHP